MKGEEVLKVEAGDDEKKADAAGGNDLGAKKHQKKRGNMSKDDEDEDEIIPQKKSKKMSYPNLHQVQKSKKKKTNAKVTKPRRMKITGM